MKNDRKHYSAEEKVAILRRHLLDKVPVSTLCEELNLQLKVATATIPPVKCPHCPQPFHDVGICLAQSVEGGSL